MSAAPTSPTDVVKTFLAAMAIKDYDTALKLMSDDCEYHNMPMEMVRGPVAARAVLEAFFNPTLENELIILRMLADGPLVFTERLDRHRNESGWVELPVNGVWEVNNGRITLWREYFDMATLLKQMPALAR